MLTRDAGILAARVGVGLELRHVVDVNLAHARAIGIDQALLSGDYQAAIADPAVGVVVELIGGVGIARTVVQAALKAGKCVVTANKALLAKHGPELYALARASGACIAFEASCGGGIPIIRALLDGLIANRIDALYGIVNGTCNYILTSMTQQSKSYAQALAEAQAAGLAEADPTLDVGGGDSAHKLAILASLAFGARIDGGAIATAGIDSLDLRDVLYGQELGYTVKLLAIGQRQEQGISLCVRPAFISRGHPLAWVSGPFNAISVYGHATGHTMYYGRGAGSMPTASAVVADLASVAIGVAQRQFQMLRLWPDLAEPARQLPVDSFRSRYYIRVMADDRPGVLAQIAAILGGHDISIASVLQHESADGAQGVPVVITTYPATEGQVRRALAQVDALSSIKSPSVCIGIVDEHPEKL
jgi:homoserine dehydrogenase